jgi:TolA-binding protein
VGENRVKRSIFLLSSIVITGLNSLYADQEEPIFRESVELRQIADYWKEQEYALAKERIHQFLQNYPNTLFKEQLYAMLADLFVKEKNYQKAIDFYQKISPEKRSQTTLFHYVYCLYQLGMWEEVIDQAPSVIRHASTTKEQLDTMRFSFADALMQNALQAADTSHKKDMLLQAESEFKRLLSTRYACDSLQSIAHINVVLENPLQAANLYLTLAEKDPANKEQYLFQAGYLQISIDPNKAIDLLEQVCELKQEKSSKAAYLLLQILFQEKQYAELLNIRDKFNDLIPSNPLISYYTGKSLYQTNNPDQAIFFLMQFLESPSIDVSYKKSAVITLISCAKITKNWSLLEEKLEYLIHFFPQDTQTLDLILMYTQLCKQEQNWEKMALYLKKALEISPNYPQREFLIYEQALCCVHQQKLEEGINQLINFLEDFPDSSHVKQAWRQLLNCCIQDVRNSSLTLYPKKQALLITHLTRALEQKDLFSDQERKDIHWLLIQSFLEQKHYQNAHKSLEEYVKQYGSSSDTYLFIALCQEHLDAHPLQIAENFEQVLLDSQTTHKRFCNRKLYNLYLSIAQEMPEKEGEALCLKAADCLFANIDEQIEVNNLDWLADFYYQQFEKAEKEQKIFYAKRAEISFEKLLNHRSLPIETDLELGVLKLCTLYNYLGEKTKKVPLLKNLTQQQQKFPQIEWKWQRRVLFELAISYQEQNLYKDAIQLYDVLIDSSKHVLSYYGTAALLEKARLQFSLLAEEEKQENSLEIMAICDALKEVQIRKKLLSEPLHLEAGLEYIEVKTCVSANPIEKKLELLLQMKESFSSIDDASVQHYLSTQDLFPDKMQLHQDYLSFIDLEITSIKALLAKKNQRKHLYQKLKTSALVKLGELETKVLHDSLQTRVQMSKEALQATL